MSSSGIGAAGTHKLQEKLFRGVTMAFGILIIALLVGILISLLIKSIPSISKFGLNFFISTDWNPSEDNEKYGALPFLLGTLATSFFSLILAIPFSLSLSILMGEYIKKNEALSSLFGSFVEILAAIPSIIYGFWGFFVLRPIMIEVERFFGVASPNGVGILTSSIILAIMILPYSASLGREVIELVPNDLKEAAFAMGATRYEVVKNVIVPYASSGIIAGILLAFGRALGETMAVTMLIGGSRKIPTSIFDICNTMASAIANEFNEATPLLESVLVELGLLLLLVTAIINIAGKYIIKKLQV